MPRVSAAPWTMGGGGLGGVGVGGGGGGLGGVLGGGGGRGVHIAHQWWFGVGWWWIPRFLWHDQSSCASR